MYKLTNKAKEMNRMCCCMCRETRMNRNQRKPVDLCCWGGGSMSCRVSA